MYICAWKILVLHFLLLFDYISELVIVLYIFIFYFISKVLNFHLRVLYSIQIHDDVYSMKIYMLMIISTMKQTGGFVRLLHCFTNKSYLYNITEVVLNVVLNNTLFRIISIPSKFCYFRPPDHVISMD